MLRGLRVNGIDEIEGLHREMPAIDLGLDPDRKELCSEIPGTDLVQTDVPDVFRIGIADVERFVKKALRRVSVCVHDDSGIMNGAGSGSDGWACVSLSER